MYSVCIKWLGIFLYFYSVIIIISYPLKLLLKIWHTCLLNYFKKNVCCNMSIISEQKKWQEITSFVSRIFVADHVIN